MRIWMVCWGIGALAIALAGNEAFAVVLGLLVVALAIVDATDHVYRALRNIDETLSRREGGK